MLRVRIISDPLDLSTYVEHTGDALLPLLQERFPIWPETARLYRGQISEETECTPRCERDLEALTDDGLYYVVVWPGDATTLIIAAIVVVAILAVAAVLFLMPKIPGPNQNPESSNNSLGQRTNKARPRGRIPDIYGRVNAVPELLGTPLIRFDDNNKEYETCFMCLGRGEYEIDPDEVFDGSTPFDNVAGGGAQFFGPSTRPGAGAPFLTIGIDNPYPLKNVTKVNGVNGQQLRAPDSRQMTGSSNVRFTGPDLIEANPASTVDFTKYFDVGDDLTITNAKLGGSPALFDVTTQVCRVHADKSIEFQSFNPSTLYAAGQTLVITNGGFSGVNGSGTVIYVDISGTYTIASVTSTTITLS